MQPIDADPNYFREYRKFLGFSNQNDVKDFFGAKDITPEIDLNYLRQLNDRLSEIIKRINSIVAKDIRPTSHAAFVSEYIDRAFSVLKDNKIIPRLNNLGRRPEQVYYNWMRGYVMAAYFRRALSVIFSVSMENITLMGDDDLNNIETFKKSPRADLQINLTGGRTVIVEMQSGFTGVNDIKRHKWVEAKRFYQESGIHTMVIHFDLYNGQVAFVNLDQIPKDDLRWITRQQMEGQTVFNIDQNYFKWRLTDSPVAQPFNFRLT